MNKKSRYILAHPFIIADKNTAENVKFIYPDTKFNKIYGENIKFKIPRNSELQEIRCCLLNDIIIRHLPRDFIKIAKSKSINVRELLLRLKSLTYSVKLNNAVTKTKINNSKEYEKRILKLRKEWFSIDKKTQKEEVIDLLNDALKTSIEIVDNFNAYLQKNKISEINKKIHNIVYSGEKNKTIFVRNWKKSKALDYSGEFISLPIDIAVQLICYSAQKGLLSNYIRKNLQPKNLEYKFIFKKIAEKSIGILNNQANLSQEHLHFPAFFDFGYRPEKGVINKIINLMT